MKILYFTFITPSFEFGGGIAVLQSLRALCANAEVDYVGPEFNEIEIRKAGIKFDNVNNIFPQSSRINRLKNFLLYGVTTSFYDSWKKVVSLCDVNKYDCIYMDFSRQDFVVRWAKKEKVPAIIRAHNVEADYFKAFYINNRSLLNFFRSKTIVRSEKYCIKNADKVLTLTEYDRERFIKLYGMGLNEKLISVMPVCIEHELCEEKIDRKKPYILLAGSLWFGPNAEGTEWFLENVWSELDDTVGKKYDLLVVGARPNSNINALVAKFNNAYLFDSPENIRPFYREAEMFIAPIFYGSGMKVKVAEALESSLMVVGTKHALVGYEAAGEIIKSADDAREFISLIKEYIDKPVEERDEIRGRIKKIFDENYSMDCCIRIMNNILTEVTD